MAKKKILTLSPKDEIKKKVDEHLKTLLNSIQPDINKKKISKKIKQARKILVKGISVKKTKTKASDFKEVASSI